MGAGKILYPFGLFFSLRSLSVNLVQSPARRERNLSMLPALFFRHIPVSLLVLVDMQLRSELVTKNDQTASKVAKSISVFSLVDSGGG